VKYSKAAAVLAGSLVALGAASIVTTAQAAEAVHGGGQPSGTGQISHASPGSHTSVTNNPVNTLSTKQDPISKVTRQANGILKGKLDPTKSLGAGAPALPKLPPVAG
jgi:hypothetical protein